MGKRRRRGREGELSVKASILVSCIDFQNKNRNTSMQAKKFQATSSSEIKSVFANIKLPGPNNNSRKLYDIYLEWFPTDLVVISDPI